MLDLSRMLAVVLAAPAAAAVAVRARGLPEDVELEAPHRLRRGIVLGFGLGVGLGQGAGYPNNSNDIGKSHFASSAWMGGSSGSLFVMGALTDYLNAGFWFEQSGFRDRTQTAAQTGIGLRLDAFPAAVVFPRLGGLGVFGEFGLGSAKLQTRGAPDVGGTQSYIGVGAFYEWAFFHVLGGHFAGGPSLEYGTVFSLPYAQSGLVASGRIAFYGGP